MSKSVNTINKERATELLKKVAEQNFIVLRSDSAVRIFAILNKAEESARKRPEAKKMADEYLNLTTELREALAVANTIKEITNPEKKETPKGGLKVVRKR